MEMGINDLKKYLNNKFLNALLVFAVLALLLWLCMNTISRKTDMRLDFLTLLSYKERLVQGFVMTILLSIGSLALSLLVGTLTAIGQNARLLFWNYLCRTYVQLIRGTPLLMQIYFFYYIIGTALGVHNRYAAGIIILSVFEGAYISEIIRGGIESIDGRQYEIAKAISLTPLQTFRLVTFPILMERILPALAGQFASIIKDSSLLSVIAVIELTQSIQEISADNFRMFENYIFLGLLYFVLTFSVSLVSKALERRYKRES